MQTIDFKKDPTYKASPEPQIIDVPEMLFVMVDGQGAPEIPGQETEFQQAMQALFGVVYTIKFWDKKFAAPPGCAKFTIAPLEGLWWMTDDGEFDISRPQDWRWTVMIRLPEFVTQEFFNKVVQECITLKKSDVYRLARLEWFDEGTCVQILHIGPYDQEGPNILKMHTYAHDQGYSLIGKHHELYFGDPRRTAPNRLKTILRQPIQPQQNL